MNKSPYIYKIATLFVCTLLLSSCMKEDMLKCPEKIRVYFTLPTGTGNDEAINLANVDRMHLYVFDEKGYFLGEYRDNNIFNFNADYYIEYPGGLPPGNYHFIAWGGKDENQYTTSPSLFIKGQTTIDEALLMFEHPNNVVTTKLHHIFHAELPATVFPTQNIQSFYMPLTQISNTINIRTVGLPADNNDYTFIITDNNCTYTFDSWFASHSHEAFTYSAPCIKNDAGQLSSSLNVLRLSANRRTPQLKILNKTTGKVLYPVGTQSGDLIWLILAAYPQNNFDKTHTYNIVLTFTGDDSTGFNVTISINGWLVNDQDEDLIV